MLIVRVTVKKTVERIIKFALNITPMNYDELENASVAIWSSKKKIYYDKNDVYVDGKKMTLNEGENLEERVNHEKRQYYSEYLKGLHFSNLVFLSGAGTSVKIGNSNGGEGGLTMAKLWDKLNELGEIKLHISNTEFGTFCNKVNYNEYYPDGEIIKDLEKLIDFASRKSFSDPSLDSEIETIKKFILKTCSLHIGENQSHLTLLRKITKRKLKDSRVKIFTTNYDTLWEQAAAKDRFTVIDGFTYSSPRQFNGRY